MKVKEVKKMLVEKGMKSEKVAGRLILWYQLATLFVLLGIVEIIDVILPVNLDIMIFILLKWVVIGSVVFDIKNVVVQYDVDKLIKNLKIAKMVCIITLLIWLYSLASNIYYAFYLGYIG